jgi:Leucine-rich repeat (LRR) protein
LKGIENLYLLNNQNIREINPAIGNLQNLKTLNIAATRISKLPTEISKLKNLRSIFLAANSFTFFPLEITNCVNLEHLDMSENYYLREITPEIGKLSNLRYLNLYGVYTHTIPKEFAKLTKLDTLLLSTDSLKSTSVLMSSLAALHLSYLKLTGLPGNKIPAQIGKLIFLTELDIHGMILKSLPAEFSNLKQLKRLDMSQIDLGHVPAQVFELPNLEFLSLWSCNLSQLPADIEKLSQLKILELGDNQLKELPVESLVKLKNLKELNTYGNYALSESQKASLIKQMPWCTIK